MGCAARGIVCDPPCGDPLGTGLERHHLGRGQWRKIADELGAVIDLCPAHHEFVTREPVKAHAVGLAWGPDSERRARDLGWVSKAVPW